MWVIKKLPGEGSFLLCKNCKGCLIKQLLNHLLVKRVADTKLTLPP
jgi:hypothetical protein